jgi:hypothetical protein
MVVYYEARAEKQPIRRKRRIAASLRQHDAEVQSNSLMVLPSMSLNLNRLHDAFNLEERKHTYYNQFRTASS